MRSPFLTTFPLLAFAAGCSANVVTSAEAADAETSAAAASVVIARTSGENARSEAVARFVRGRFGPIDDESMRWLGLDSDMPAAGSCARIVADPPLPSAGLRLLDVGQVRLTTQASREPVTLELTRRRMPDVADVVSGVVYTASDLELPTRGGFEIQVAGEPELSAVRVQTDFAGEPASLRIGGQDAAIVVASESPLDVVWDAADGGDTVYVDITANDTVSHKASVTRCVFNDVGRGSLPASAFGDADGTIAVHRLHRAALRAPGIERGELRLDFARELTFQVKRDIRR